MTSDLYIVEQALSVVWGDDGDSLFSVPKMQLPAVQMIMRQFAFPVSV